MVQELPKPKGGATTFNPYKVRTSPFFSHAAHSNGPCTVVITAGEIGTRLDGSAPSDRVEQYELALANLRRCLEAAGAGVNDILKLTYYIVGYDSKNPVHRQPLLNFLGDARPATTLIGVEKLAAPEILFEIEATAAIPQFPTERVDVVVVGGGLSGLQAAVDLKKSGLSVKVLEARNRVGGKTLSRDALGSKCDMGAAWINDTNQARMFELAKRFGLELIVQNTNGKYICDQGIGNHKTHPYGELNADANDKADIDDIVRIRDIFEETCQKVDISDPAAWNQRLRQELDNVTFEQWLKSLDCGQAALNSLRVGTRAMLGVEPSELSALYFLDYCKSGGGYMLMRSDQKHGGQYLRIASGTQSFSHGLAAELGPESVILQSPVRKIEHFAGGVRVTSARGVLEAGRVIVSVPTPLYQEVVFDPPLPEKMALSKATRLGDYGKMIVFYRTPWWRKNGLTGMSQSSQGPFGVTRDTSVDADGHYSLTCFMVGGPAREWAKLEPEARKESVIGKIKQLFSKFVEPEEPIHFEEQIWKNEQWSQGCPCPVMGPGDLTKFQHVLRAPAGRIHFVGTETAYEWKGYMEGAVRSGERGAQEVLLSLNKAKL